jgi:hypothetical protein
MENLTKVPNEFLPLTQVPPMIEMKTQILNLKKLKTQVSMKYLTNKKKKLKNATCSCCSDEENCLCKLMNIF